jgi:SAM-dependent MidA family methyltransferase
LNQICGNAALIDLIRREINECGPVPFAWFMQQALYHPEHGYYSSGRSSIGRGGDFFTNVSVGPLFGRLLARQFAQMWDRLDRPNRFSIVEQGGHDAHFARDVLDSSATSAPGFFAALQYRMVEPFPVWHERQQQTLGRRLQSGAALLPKVEWQTQLEPFVGVHFSNELLDAMPTNLRGKAVSLAAGRFVLIDAAEDGHLPPNQSQLDWIDNLASRLQRGFAVIVDYGFAGHDYREMVQTRAKHRKLDSPFEQIGEADITAHLNWTAIARRAESRGLRVLGFVDQHHFLTGIVSDFPEFVPDASTARHLQTLLHPEMLGRAFQVLLLGKDIDPETSLSGLKYARDVRATLDL